MNYLFEFMANNIRALMPSSLYEILYARLCMETLDCDRERQRDSIRKQIVQLKTNSHIDNFWLAAILRGKHDRTQPATKASAYGTFQSSDESAKWNRSRTSENKTLFLKTNDYDFNSFSKYNYERLVIAI